MNATLGLALVLARPAHAQGLGPTLLSYRAPDDCPEVAEFQKSVQRRSARVRFVDEGSHERELSIALSKDGDFTIGELRLIERDGSLRQRSVRFTSCAEAVEGLALITVVSLDPQALVEGPPTPEPAQPKQTPPLRPAKPARMPAPPVPTPAETPPPPSQPAPLKVALGAEFVAGLRQLPQTALGGALFVDVASGSSSWFAPWLRVAIAHSERRGISTGDAEASFAVSQATLFACPVKIGDRAISVSPCALTAAGVVRAWSANAADPHARTRPAWGWGGSVQVLLRVTQTVGIVGNFDGISPLVRDRFEVQPSWSWKTPPLYLSSGAGFRFVFR